MITVSAPVSVIPTPPARVESRKSLTATREGCQRGSCDTEAGLTIGRLVGIESEHLFCSILSLRRPIESVERQVLLLEPVLDDIELQGD